MKKTIVFLSALFLLFSFIQSCRSTNGVAGTITIANGQIPPDMATEDFTIIGILHDRKSYDKWVEKDFTAYPGNSVTATMDELRSTYKDIKKYRYLMDGDMKSERSSSTNGQGRITYSTVISYTYYILDRKTGTTYRRKNGSSFFSKEMIAYLKAIEAVRKK